MVGGSRPPNFECRLWIMPTNDLSATDNAPRCSPHRITTGTFGCSVRGIIGFGSEYRFVFRLNRCSKISKPTFSRVERRCGLDESGDRGGISKEFLPESRRGWLMR